MGTVSDFGTLRHTVYLYHGVAGIPRVNFSGWYSLFTIFILNFYHFPPFSFGTNVFLCHVVTWLITCWSLALFITHPCKYLLLVLLTNYLDFRPSNTSWSTQTRANPHEHERTSVCAGASEQVQNERQHVCSCVNEDAGHRNGGKGLEKDGTKHRCLVITSRMSDTSTNEQGAVGMFKC